MLREAGLPAGTAEAGGDIAVDLGRGPGRQTLAPARLGYAPVIAVDTSALLLSARRRHRAPPGRTVPGHLPRPVPGSPGHRPLHPCAPADDRLLTRFLDYTDDDTVQVHDLLHVRGTDGDWELRTSSSPKLRLGPAWLADQCRDAGLEVRRAVPGPRGLQLLHAVKPGT